MEQVMSQLANYFCDTLKQEVILIILTRAEHFYPLSKEIEVIEPEFNHNNYSRATFSLKILLFLRNQLKFIKPDTILSFGGRYNSFVLISATNLNLNVYISDRSRPDISYGGFIDVLNKFYYKSATGIIAQTSQAKDILFKKTKNRNIKVIANPIKEIENFHDGKENIILNVGRFIKSKQQLLLIQYFNEIDNQNWKLMFLGDGRLKQEAVRLVEKLGLESKVFFLGNVVDIDRYYRKAKIFAFTSISEGFPNALGEAMRAGLACISFNCFAGPSDIIDNNINGFLVRNNDKKSYCEILNRLIKDSDLRSKIGINAKQKMEKFALSNIGNEYYRFLLNK